MAAHDDKFLCIEKISQMTSCSAVHLSASMVPAESQAGLRKLAQLRLKLRAMLSDSAKPEPVKIVTVSSDQQLSTAL